MKKFFAYFEFSKTERRGFTILIILLVIVQFAPNIYSYFSNQKPITYSVKYLENTDKDLELYNRSSNHVKNHNQIQNKNITYFEFDPNTITDSQWELLGFSIKQIKVIRNYLNKGGHFYRKEDLKKIYSITENDYSRLVKYIVINENKKFNNTSYSKEQQNTERIKKSIIININEADTSDLKRIYGIGSVLSDRIIKFRDGLGGFHHVNQLKEVYGLKDEVFLELAKVVKINPNHVKKININTSSKEQLSRHPYIKSKLAQLIVNYRNQHGDFKNVETLTEIKVLDREILLKIEPYLEF